MLSILIPGLLLAIALPLWFVYRRSRLRQRTLKDTK